MSTGRGFSLASLRGQVKPYIGLLRGTSLASLLMSKSLTRTGRDALLFALIVGIVKETGDTRDTTLAVLAYTIPSVVLGLFGGAVAERTSVRPLLLLGHLSRAAVVLAMLGFSSHLWGQYTLLAGFVSLGLFVGPAEAAALPRLVDRDELGAAHSLQSFLGMMGSVLGAIVIGPILFAVSGWSAVILMSAGVHLAAALIALGIRVPRDEQQHVTTWATASAIFLVGWRSIHASPRALIAFGYLMIALSLGKVAWALAPYYTRDVLGISPEKTVFIAAPAAIGAAFALVATPVIGRALGVRRAVDIGFFALLLGVLSVGTVAYASDFVMNHVDLHVGYIEERVGTSPLIVITMLIAIPVGFGSTMLGIASATTVNQEMSATVQARAAATGGSVSSAVSLVPLFGVAAAAGLIGVRGLLMVVALGALAVAISLRRYAHRPVQPIGAGEHSPRF